MQGDNATNMRQTIWVLCEGSDTPNRGYCQMCGCGVLAGTDLVPRHHRQDLLAMIDRGDFDVADVVTPGE